MNSNKDAESLTFRRGAEVSQETLKTTQAQKPSLQKARLRARNSRGHGLTLKGGVPGSPLSAL